MQRWPRDSAPEAATLRCRHRARWERPVSRNSKAIYGSNAFVPAPVGFGPDVVWNYELGRKNAARWRIG